MTNKDFPIDTPELKRKIGLSSIYTVYNEKHDHTFFGTDNPHYKNAVRLALNKAWDMSATSLLLAGYYTRLGIQHRPMLRLLNWFRTQGHRHRPDYHKYPHKYMLAWDVARYANMTRNAYIITHINKRTALHHLDHAYRLSKHAFTSWEDYVLSFLAFKRIWDTENLRTIKSHIALNAPELSAQDIDVAYHLVASEIRSEGYEKHCITDENKLTAKVAGLLNDPQSIWNQVPW